MPTHVLPAQAMARNQTQPQIHAQLLALPASAHVSQQTSLISHPAADCMYDRFHQALPRSFQDVILDEKRNLPRMVLDHIINLVKLCHPSNPCVKFMQPTSAFFESMTVDTHVVPSPIQPLLVTGPLSSHFLLFERQGQSWSLLS
jgi:hypothetical protein